MAIISAFLRSHWLQLAIVAVCFVAGFTAAWRTQSLNVTSIENELETYRNEVKQNALLAREAALEKERFWIAEKENALNNAQQREAKLRTERDAALVASRRLRDDIATLRTRLPNAIPSAVIATADTLAGLLDQCQQEYRGMAEIADGHASDVQTLIDAWPK